MQEATEAGSRDQASVPAVWRFDLAGAAAGLTSGLVRNPTTARLVAVQCVSAVFLLGGFHWWAVRMWRRVYRCLAD